MNMMSYLFPKETILLMIVIAIIIGIAYVGLKIFDIYSVGKANLFKIVNLSDVGILKQALIKNNVDTEQIFTDFETAREKTVNTETLFQHIKVIYDAGQKSNRLDEKLLIQNTIAKIFKEREYIKSCISLFLVIGIFGTLLGLAISLGNLSGASFDVLANAKGNNDAAVALNELFKNLRGAFAPSMWGVFATIICILGYSLVQKAYIDVLNEKLTDLTLHVWIPELYPTDLQKSKNSIVKLNETIKNADNINADVNTLNNNLTCANKTLEELSNVSELLNNSSIQFQIGSEKLANFQSSIKELYDQISINNSEVSEFLHGAVAKNIEYQQKGIGAFFEQSKVLQENFAGQNQQISIMLKSLKMYEENYCQNQKTIYEGIAKSAEENYRAIAEMKTAAESITNRNQDIVKAIGAPLQKNVIEGLANIEGKMVEGLDGISVQLKRIQNPLEDTAGQIEKMFGVYLKNFRDSANAIVESSKKAIQHSSSQNPIDGVINTVVSSDVDMEPVINKLEEIKAALNRPKDNQKADFFKDIEKFLPTVIAVLLFLGIVMQIIMVNKISSLEKNQTAVTELLINSNRNR